MRGWDWFQVNTVPHAAPRLSVRSSVTSRFSSEASASMRDEAVGADIACATVKEAEQKGPPFS